MERMERKGWRPLTLGEAIAILRAAGLAGAEAGTTLVTLAPEAGTTLVTLAPETGTTLVVLAPDGVEARMGAGRKTTTATATTMTSGGRG